jgi:hypothetical protein
MDINVTRRISGNPVGIQQGTRVLFSDFIDDGPMWAGAGQRESRHHIRFRDAFAEAPAVMVGVSMWDLDKGTNMRADLKAENITESGFELVFRTWDDTRIARVRADWTAIGPLPDEDAWDLY